MQSNEEDAAYGELSAIRRHSKPRSSQDKLDQPEEDKQVDNEEEGEEEVEAPLVREFRSSSTLIIKRAGSNDTANYTCLVSCS